MIELAVDQIRHEIKTGKLNSLSTALNLETEQIQIEGEQAIFKGKIASTENSLEFAFDWDVQSHTLSFFYHQYFSDKVLFRYRYRYYLQTAANFYQTSYSTIGPLMTSDYKLQAFNAHLFGLKIEYKLEDLVKKT